MYPCDQHRRLPTICIYAGAEKKIYFPVRNKSGDAVNAAGCTGKFSAVNCANRSGNLAIEKTATVVAGIGDTLMVSLSPNDTINLEGKFIYQIWIRGADGVYEEPQQGDLYIIRNIDKTFI